MEKLQEILIGKITTELARGEPNIRYLDILNMLLATVSNYLLAKQ